MKTSKKASSASHPQRLYRSEADRVVGGVAAGIADYLNIDPVLIRLAFVVITLAGGSGVLVYLVLWLVIPSETQETIISEENIKKNAEEIKDKAEEFAKEFKDTQKYSSSRQIIAICLFGLGIILLFQNFGLFTIFNPLKLWPLIFVFIAIVLLKNN
ncbi:hypothetical protein A2382_03400 [Candidatus Woesebacteria bacterium RIFOXYB1_FULL_38_16]|uniref:Phage shock protein PspC N-terminal domain-containing protein n=1 Tax=Candidatus Woesebacteria bacterium RIFOXYB1_FULL_38_16 TaxID=1802538 RepID=A0A1F8CRK3_9BACT|nr:MAG: hypothetical protein A2191_03685 [Candidatus Woesebacteria bacterium RIFOXYA1_FULL_38_9]OGM78912.1 MAG: hypothetical protein A2382_03400 [Candidatus Woesebacteria bacterium RIFOXYB1_FULL_38_16]